METARSAGSGPSDSQVRSVLGSFFFSGDAVDKKVQVLSGGEKMRLAFARLFLNPPNFMILDEPTTHLDIGSREALELALKEYDGALLFVSHDVEFVTNIASSVIAMTPPTIQRYPGGYEYYKEKTGGITGDTPVKEPRRKDVLDKKTLRRMRSEERKAAAARERPLKAEVAKQEKEIERLEAEQKELAEKLSTPDADFASLNRRLNELHYEIQIATELWEQATLALEEISG
jgi:ATP-binding cassette subfamily F protein 3